MRHRLRSTIATILITAGVVVLTDAAVTLLWQEPVSAAYASFQQKLAGDELEEVESQFDPGSVGALTIDASEAARARALAESFRDQIDPGQPIGRVKIESIGVDSVLMNGTDTATLQKGPGRYSDTPLPGMGKTTGIAGHRTTYGAPFRRINEIEVGDEIRVELPYATFTYRVQKHEIVEPREVQIVDPVGYERVVLTACHPLHSAAERWATFARLTDIETLEISGQGEWLKE